MYVCTRSLATAFIVDYNNNNNNSTCVKKNLPKRLLCTHMHMYLHTGNAFVKLDYSHIFCVFFFSFYIHAGPIKYSFSARIACGKKCFKLQLLPLLLLLLFTDVIRGKSCFRLSTSSRQRKGWYMYIRR